ncbi:MAG: hypothetical protein J6W96_04895 [Alphaproteobacteria bacterium]|nr:hypothetical protein [Alphaproteobacteria bacterium]
MVDKITNPVKPLDVIDKINEIIDNLGGGTVDNALSLTSENPVQNKVVTQALTELSANVNMDAYLDMIISGNYSSLPIIMQSEYSSDLDDIIGGTYDNNS